MKNFIIKSVLGLTALGSLASAHAAVLTGPIQNPANGHYYYLLANDTWTASQSQAVALGGNLVTVNDAAENTWLAATFLNYGGVRRDLWLGLSDAASEGHFQWADGEPFTYANWEPSQPDNGMGFYPVENYVHMFGGTGTEHLPGWFAGGWNDFQDLASYTSKSGTFRELCGVVEVVPEPSLCALLIAGATVLLWFRKALRGSGAFAEPVRK